MDIQHTNNKFGTAKVSREVDVILVAYDKHNAKEIFAELKPLGAVIEPEIGWWISSEHRNKVVEICGRYNLASTEKTMSQSTFDMLKPVNTLAYFESMLAKKHEQLQKLPGDHELLSEIDNLTAKIHHEQDNLKAAADKTTNDYSRFLKNNSKAEITEALTNLSPAISTGYLIRDKIDHDELDTHVLKFPGGGITIVAAQTGHGKTTALINFAQGIINNNQQKRVYFFTYEESKEAILIKHLSASAGINLAANNKRAIEHFLRFAEFKYIYEQERDNFSEKASLFFEKFIDNGALRVIDEALPVEQLIDAIKYIARNDSGNVGAIFIDYIQLLKLHNSRKASRQEELKEICIKLMECAKETGLPIILAAQFNRTVTTLEDMSVQSIGEAGDIERQASLIIGLWNHKHDKNEPDEKKLTVKILKSRDTESSTVEMIFDGNLKLIRNMPDSTCTNNSATKNTARNRIDTNRQVDTRLSR